MQHFGYVANQTQTNAALGAIKFGFSYLPAIFFVVGALIMISYFRFEKNESAVIQELEMRRKRGTTEPEYVEAQK